MKLGLVIYLSSGYVTKCGFLSSVDLCLYTFCDYFVLYISGLNIVEQSLWKAVPHYLRRVSNALKKVYPSFGFEVVSFSFCIYGLQYPSYSHIILLFQHTGKPLPLTCAPIRFGSWMGGDRDGNPNVTAKVRHFKMFALYLGWVKISTIDKIIWNDKYSKTLVVE